MEALLVRCACNAGNGGNGGYWVAGVGPMRPRMEAMNHSHGKHGLNREIYEYMGRQPKVQKCPHCG